MNKDIQDLESALDEAYGGSLLARLGHLILRILNGMEKRLRDIEKRFEDTEG